ncbi:TIGR02530 family flagellar biosynthesis protein [Bacillus sp. SCS-151]|uniref:TIGR02530 family flagellar biosynthesis protein n=1 Tax=Nanhaiella sioensis TaxID=3115293 RepID=UPI00397B494D
MTQRIIHAYQQHQISPKNNHVSTTKQPASADFKTQFGLALASTNELKISKHASQRIMERNITIDNRQWNKISEKVAEAKQMGIQDSLVLLNNAALIVSAKNNTVVTAMDRKAATTQIFSNINGTIIID